MTTVIAVRISRHRSIVCNANSTKAGLTMNEREMYDNLEKLMGEKEKGLAAEDQRLSKRITAIEEKVDKIGDLTVSVSNLAQSVQAMAREMEKQGNRLQAIESRDGDMWRKAVGYAITAIIGIIIGYVFQQVGM